MKKHLSKLALTASLIALPFSTASALTISSIQGDPDGYLTSGLTLIYDFEAPSYAPTEINGAYTIFGVPSGTSQSAPPLGLTAGDHYLSVPNPASTGTANIYFAQDFSILGLYWGSIDQYNKIEFYNNGIATGDVVFGGNLPPATGGQTALNQNLYVTISDLALFDEIRLTSTSYAFEIDNIAAAVPEPGTMLLFGAGILGLAGFARRKQS